MRALVRVSFAQVVESTVEMSVLLFHGDNRREGEVPQGASWEYQTKLWHRRICLFAFAMFVICEPRL
jgi:hypothetical protein